MHPESSIKLLSNSPRYFIHLNFFIYDGLCRSSLIKAKFKHSAPDAFAFTQAIENTLLPFITDLKRQYPKITLTCVPGVKKRIQHRQFNFLHYCCQQWQAAFDIPFNAQLIARQKDTPSQKALTLHQRRQNVRGTFKVHSEVKGKTILLMDDIFTTGATVSQITRQLYQKGAGQVLVLTLALKP